jgi:ketosteroid isomerase-like protein
VAHVAEDAVFSAGTPLVGRVAVAAHWSRYLAADGPTLRWRPTAAGVAPSGDLGWTTGEARYAWKQKGIDQSGLRYVTVWRKGAGGRWEVVLDGSLEPVPPGPSTRTPVRTFTSSDGLLEGSIGTFRRVAGDRTITGIFLVVLERQGGAWRTVHESEMPTG